MADMVVTPSQPGLTPELWDTKFFREYIRDNRFMKYMGTDAGAMIQLNVDLKKAAGDTITFAARRRLQGAGVTGDTLLEGNEEILDLRSMKLTVNPIRHAVAVTNWDEQRSTVPIREAARDALKDWAMEKLRNDLIVALFSLNGVPFPLTTASQQNTWLSNNSDRVLFGSAYSNNTGTMSTSLLNVSSAAGRLSAAILSTAKRGAKLANPHIRPIQVKGDQEWFVCFVPSFAFRDLGNDPNVQTTYQYAANRGPANILFTDDDIIIKGVIVREIPEMQTIVGVGGSGQNVAQCTMCGAQALGIAWAQTTKSTTNTRDYNFRHGVGIEEIRGIDKLHFGRNTGPDVANQCDNGIFSLFVSGIPDT